MTLPIIREAPPCYAEAIKLFPFAKRPGTVFTYGNAIFMPVGDGKVSPWLMQHEMVHSQRQALVGGPAAWWRRYLDDAQFRFDEELPAHIREYESLAGQSRGERRYYLRQIAGRLSGPLYGRMVTLHKAKQLITGRKNPDL